MCVDDELLNTYLDGELQEPWRTQVEQHLSYCNACKGRLEHLRALDAKLRAADLTDEDIRSHKDRVMSYFEKGRFSNKKLSLFKRRVQVRLVPALLTSAAAFVVVFIGAFVLFGTNSGQTEQILPGVAVPVDSANVRQISEIKPATLDNFTLEQIVQYLDAKGYAVKLELKAVTPIEQ
ncbi:MAG: zf-HC2 domain-containing protein [Sphaerochaetaceae bacterium]